MKLEGSIAAIPAPEQEGIAAAVAALLDRPDAELDLAEIKIACDLLIDPGADCEWTRREIAQLAETARRLAGPDAGEARKYAALRTLIYDPGEWNGFRPFAYDHDDPEGQEIGNKLLPNYLRTRRGNCVSMPALFLILAERLDLDVALAAAPLHLFVRLRIDGHLLNIETTSGGHPARDSWYRRNFSITDRALEGGIYMRCLTRRETAAHFATTVVERLIDTRAYGEAAVLCADILRHFPRDVYTMVKLGTCWAYLLDAELAAQPQSELAMCPRARSRTQALRERNRAAFAAAEALGWTPTI